MTALETIARLLGHHAGEDRRGLRVDLLVDLADVRDIGLHHFQHQAQRAFVLERRVAGQHFVEHDAQREDVRALVDRLGHADFRRQVARRADELAGAGELLREVRAGQRDTEVGDLHLAARRHHQVAGLDVPMHDALVVRGGKALGGLVDDLQRVGDVELLLALQYLRQALALDELHDEERLFVLLSDEVDLDDVRVVQRRHRTRLAQETLDQVLVVRQRRRQLLDGDITAQRRFVALVDHAHAAATEFADDFVVTEMRFHGRLRRRLGLRVHGSTEFPQDRDKRRSLGLAGRETAMGANGRHACRPHSAPVLPEM